MSKEGIFNSILGKKNMAITRTISLTPEQDEIYKSIPSGDRSKFIGVALELAKNGKLPTDDSEEVLKDIEADEPKTIDDIKHHFDDKKKSSQN